MKYIIYADKQLRMETPIIFPEFLTHINVAEKIDPNMAITSAGFCKLCDNKFQTYGMSESLKLSSRKKDTDLLNVIMGE